MAKLEIEVDDGQDGFPVVRSIKVDGRGVGILSAFVFDAHGGGDTVPRVKMTLLKCTDYSEETEKMLKNIPWIELTVKSFRPLSEDGGAQGEAGDVG